MFLNKNSITIDNVDMGQYLLEVEYGYNKLWGNDSGRNLKGKMTGTLIGIFPKLKLTFRKLTQTELEKICKILDKANQSVTYYDPYLKRNYTMTTYTGDWATLNRSALSSVPKANQSFSISFIAIEKRPNS